MRILQIASLITPDGAYGGPTRVAVNQVSALRDAGHEVTLLAAAHGFDGPLPETFDGVPVKLFPARRLVPGTGFAGLTSPGMHRWLMNNMQEFDIAHVHLARDLVSLPAAALLRSAKRSYVLQTHGMVDESSKLLAHLLDTLATRRVLASAAAVFFLTPEEGASLSVVGGKSLRLRELLNGVPQPATVNTVADGSREVLFLARLHERKRPAAFVNSALALTATHPDVSFKLVGPDEGEASKITRLMSAATISHRIAWEGPLEPKATSARMRECLLYVLPSIHEPFPMSVLEALSFGKPVIVTKSCGLAPFIETSASGLVVSHEEDELTAAIDRLLSDSALRTQMGKNAARLAESRFSMASVLEVLDQVYAEAVRPIR